MCYICSMLPQSSDPHGKGFGDAVDSYAPFSRLFPMASAVSRSSQEDKAEASKGSKAYSSTALACLSLLWSARDVTVLCCFPLVTKLAIYFGLFFPSFLKSVDQSLWSTQQHG